jgi:hypothetical protein
MPEAPTGFAETTPRMANTIPMMVRSADTCGRARRTAVHRRVGPDGAVSFWSIIESARLYAEGVR